MVAILGVLFLLSGVTLQPDQPTVPAAGSALDASSLVEPHLDVLLLDPNVRVRAWQDLRLVVKIYSGSSPSGIGIDSLTLYLPGSMGIRVPKHAGDTDNAAEHSGDIDKTIETPAELREPGARIELPPVELEGISARELGFSKILGLLTYRAGRERIVAVLKYKKLDDAVQRSYTTSLDLDVSGHPLGMYTGAIVGTFLIGLFQAIMRRPRGSLWSSAKAIGRDFSLRFIRGLIATGIAILVLQTTSDIQFPITVTVQDFYGGVILGLFGDQIAQVIQRRISRRRQAA